MDVSAKQRELVKLYDLFFLVAVFLVTAQELCFLIYYLFEQGFILLLILFNNLQNVDLGSFSRRLLTWVKLSCPEPCKLLRLVCYLTTHRLDSFNKLIVGIRIIKEIFDSLKLLECGNHRAHSPKLNGAL